MKKTVVFDFDGVIHSYTSGWQGKTIIPDPPVHGIDSTICKLREEGYEVVIVSARSDSEDGRLAIKEWLNKYGITVDKISSTKPPALVYVDDRAICFNGNTAMLFDEIKNFKPWNKK